MLRGEPLNPTGGRQVAARGWFAGAGAGPSAGVGSSPSAPQLRRRRANDGMSLKRQDWLNDEVDAIILRAVRAAHADLALGNDLEPPMPPRQQSSYPLGTAAAEPVPPVTLMLSPAPGKHAHARPACRQRRPCGAPNRAESTPELVLRSDRVRDDRRAIRRRISCSVPDHGRIRGPDTPIARVAALMAWEGIHRLPVCGPAGDVIGIVSTRDVARWVARVTGQLSG